MSKPVSQQVLSSREPQLRIGVALLGLEGKNQISEFSSMLQICPFPAWLSDENGCRVYFNKAWLDFRGQTADFELNDGWVDGVHPDDLESLLKTDQTAHEKNIPYTAETRIRGFNGEYRWISIQAGLIQDSSGLFIGLAGYCLDITSGKEKEQKLIVKKNRYKLAIENTGLGLWDWDITSNATIFNRRYAEILEYEYDEMDTQFHCLDRLIHPDDQAEALEKLQRHLDGKSPSYESEHRLKSKYGDWIWIQDRGKVVDRDSNGKPLRMTGTHRDTTMRKEMEESMRRLSLVASRSNTAVVIANAVGEVEWVNLAFVKMSGYDLFDMEGQKVGKLLQGPGSDPEVIAYMSERTKQGKEFHAEILNYQKSGQSYWVDIEGTPIFDRNGKLIQYIAIESDITARKLAEGQMKTAKEAAEAANQAKSDFLANMSHEIRTPMNAVMGMTSLLMDTELSEDQLDFAQTIQTSNEALLKVINDILDFSKIESGKLDLEDVAFSLTGCLEEAIELFGPAAAEKGLELLCHIDDKAPEYLIGDPTRLRQILINLLGNAIKFTSEGEIVTTVTLDEKKGGKYILRFSVRDTGIGIPVERQGILFEAFTQVDASTTRQYGGTGLGLVISKRLSTLMGGDIGLRSEEGKGSEFFFTAKLRPDKNPPSATFQAESLMGKRVLIVDDNATNRHILTLLLSKWGIYADESESGAKALAKLDQSAPYEAAILDYQMPHMDGMELATTIRNSPSYGNLPLIMLSSITHPDTVKLRQQLDLSAYLNKPVKKYVLLNALRHTLQNSPAQNGVIGRTRSPFQNLPASKKNINLLLAEDNPVNQKVALLLLKRLGYRADVASDGDEVLRSMEKECYDVILMDVQMPKKDGIETTQAIRETFSQDRQPYLIALTAGATVKDKKHCLNAGMDAYLSKPIKIKDLAMTLEAAHEETAHKRLKNLSQLPVPE